MDVRLEDLVLHQHSAVESLAEGFCVLDVFDRDETTVLTYDRGYGTYLGRTRGL